MQGFEILTPDPANPNGPPLRMTAAGLPVVSPISYVDVTLSPDLAVLAAGDLIADTQLVANALTVVDGKGILHSIAVIDEDDQGAAMDLYFFSGAGTMGAENAAPSITDAAARDFLCVVPVLTTDYKDLGGVRVADLNGLNRLIKAAAGTRNIYVAAVNGAGAPTFTATGLKLRVGVLG